MLKERRKEIDHVSADRHTKQIIVMTVCAIAFLMALTMAYLAIISVTIPDQIDRLATLLVGALVGCLVKTGVDKLDSHTNPTGKPDDPVAVTTPKDSPLPVTETEPGDETTEPPSLDDDLTRTRPIHTAPFTKDSNEPS